MVMSERAYHVNRGKVKKDKPAAKAPSKASAPKSVKKQAKSTAPKKKSGYAKTPDKGPNPNTDDKGGMTAGERARVTRVMKQQGEARGQPGGNRRGGPAKNKPKTGIEAGKKDQAPRAKSKPAKRETGWLLKKLRISRGS